MHENAVVFFVTPAAKPRVSRLDKAKPMLSMLPARYLDTTRTIGFPNSQFRPLTLHRLMSCNATLENPSTTAIAVIKTAKMPLTSDTPLPLRALHTEKQPQSESAVRLILQFLLR